MQISFDAEELRPLVRAIVAEVLAQAAGLMAQSDRLAYTEPEAASLLGIRSHQLRDARLRGEVTATKVGGRIGYERSELLAYLARQRA